MEKQITLEQWLEQIKATSYNKYLDKWLTLKVTREFSSAEESFSGDKGWKNWIKLSNKYFPNHRFVFSFITLENGWAIGWNENPGRGWSFPRSIEKYDYPKK